MGTNFNPSPQAWEKLGNAAMGLFEAFDNAEANVQYKAAYETLRKSTIDFNNSLATDPEPEKYVDKWDKAKEQIWKNATRTVKNQGALKALEDTWQNMDIQQYQSVSGIQTQARVEKTVDSALTTSQQISQDNTIPNEARKKKIRDVWAPVKAAGMRSPDSVDKYMATMDKAVDQSSMEEGLRQIGRKSGFGAALDLIDNPDFTKLFPSLTPGDRDVIRSKMGTEFRFQEQQQKKALHDVNAKIEDQFSHDLLDGKLTPQAIDKAQLVDEPGGRGAGDIRKEWRATLLTHPGRGISDQATQNKYLKWYYDPDVSHDADSVRSMLRQLNEDKAKLTEGDYTKIGNDYLALLKDPNKTDATMNGEAPEWAAMKKNHPDLIDSLDYNHNLFLKWRSSNRSASDVEVQKMSKFYQNQAIKNVVDDAVSNLYPGGGRSVATAAATAAPPRYAGGHPPDKAAPPVQYPKPLVDALAKVKTSVASSYVSGGRTYYIGADGHRYQVVNGVVGWWDGSKWQTFK